MPYTNFESYKNDIENNGISFPYYYDGWIYGFIERFSDPIAAGGEALSTPIGVDKPTTPTVCDKNTIGSLNQFLPNFSPSQNFVLKSSLADYYSDICFGILIDRLTHQGGLNSNITTPQTTNLPTAALTRYTDGAGVMIGITNYSNIGTVSNGPTITVSYTNQSNISGRITTARSLPGPAYNFSILPLQDNDYGVRSVESVTISNVVIAGSDGDFGVCLFKPICMFGASFLVSNRCINNDILSGSMLGGIPSFSDNACLLPIFGSRQASPFGAAVASGAGGEIIIGAN